MKERPDLLLTLLDGLDADERRFVLDQIHHAHAEQLDQRRHPARRRRRDANGRLVRPEELGVEAP